MSLLNYFAAFLASFVITLISVPFIRYLSVRFRTFERINDRKIHRKKVTTLGGLAFYLSFLFAVVVTKIISWGPSFEIFRIFHGIAFGSLILLPISLYDDLKGADALIKLSGQCLVALIMIKFGFLITNVYSPWGGFFELGIFSVPITILFFVGFINALNLIDGLDGLASGIAFISSLGLLALSFCYIKNSEIALLLVIILGFCLAFLRYNSYPAKIFMGDTGSMLLGFLLATLAIDIGFRNTNCAGLQLPVFIILGIPIIDTFLAIIRRLIRQRHIFKADRAHIHHWLLKIGLNQRQAVFSLYALNIFLCILALFVARLTMGV